MTLLAFILIFLVVGFIIGFDTATAVVIVLLIIKNL